jgi:hypothetical protein
MTTANTSPSSPSRRWRRRPVRVALTAAAVAGAVGVALTGVSYASEARSMHSSPPASRGWFAPAGHRAGWGPWGRPGSSTEYIDVASTNEAGPGAIILTGVLDIGGVEHPGRAIDQVSFSSGTFRIDHSSGQPTVTFDKATCVGMIVQTGPFRIEDGTGRFAGLDAQGRYYFHATYTTSRGASGSCTQTTTAYIETIRAAARLTPSEVKSLSS